MPATLRYNDWEIAEKHRDLVQSTINDLETNLDIPSGVLRGIQLWRQIPGVAPGTSRSRGRFIGPDFRAGVYIQPSRSRPIRTYSSVHDMARESLLVCGVGKSTAQSVQEPVLSVLSNELHNLFAHKRILAGDGELYSYLGSPVDHDIDQSIARQMDLLILPLVSVFREDR